MPGAVALGQVSDGALERKAHLARIRRGVCDTHDHGYHLVDLAARRRHLRKRAGHLVETVTRLVRVPHQLVQVAVHLIDALAGGVHDGLDVGSFLVILIPSTGDLVHRQAFYHLLAGAYHLVRDALQGCKGDDIQCAELGLNRVQSLLHAGKVHVLAGGLHLFETLCRAFEAELLFQLVQRPHGIPAVFLELRVVKPHFDHTLVYLLTHSRLTSSHAFLAISSKIGRMAGLM